jgi:hypothetical protein
MNKVWNRFSRSVLAFSIALLVVACGNAGPEEKRTSIAVPIGVSNSSSSLSDTVSSSQFSSIATLAVSSAQCTGQVFPYQPTETYAASAAVGLR